MPTPLYPTFQKRIKDAIEELVTRQVTPWASMTAVPTFRVKHFDGREIVYGGILFDGSPRVVFWGGYIEPFLEHLCVGEIATAVSMAKEREVDGRLLLQEVRDLLLVGVTRVYTRMADVDRGLRGRGYPDRVALTPIEDKVQRMETFVAERIQAEIDMWQVRESSMQNAPFQAVDLLDHQKALFLELVKADHSVSLEHKGRFIIVETMSGPPSVLHEGIPGGLHVGKGDIESLGDSDLLRIGRGSRGSITFQITPFGIKYAQWLRGHIGEPLRRVSDNIRSYLGSATFQAQYKVAYQKWTQAEDALWREDSANHLTTIGHLCREVLQEFCTVLVEKYQPANVTMIKTHIVDRLRSVLKQHQTMLGDTVEEFLQSLLAYWGTLIDLVQRQEHGATKEGEPLTWEDAQRVVFHTAVVMWEIDRSLNRMRIS